MGRQRSRFLAKAIAVLAAVPLLMYAYEYGPDAGVADVPGELGNCNQESCHTGTPVNFGGGNVTITFPGDLSYAPGVKQHLVVVINDPQQVRWGFELAARLAGDPKAVAGTFSPTSRMTQLMCAASDFEQQFNFNTACPAKLPLSYIEHTLIGANTRQPNPGQYEFDWTPPASVAGPITFYVAANAANGDNTANGDHIYTATYTLQPPAPDPPASSCQAGAPMISAVQNGAGLQNNIQQQSWVQITGCNLASSSRMWQPGDFVNGQAPVQLDDVRVTIDGLPAVINYISSTQINVIAPVDSYTGPVNVVVSNASGTSAPMQVALQTFSPAFFTWGGKYAAAADGATWLAPPNFFGPMLPTVPAKPGETVTLWGTGFGPVSPAPPAGVLVPASPVSSVTASMSVTVAGQGAQFISGALFPGAVGVYQIMVKLPDNLPVGDQPVQASIGGVLTPDGVFLNIQN